MFINLQYEITGTENHLVVERMRHNRAVQKYNQETKQFYQSLKLKLLASNVFIFPNDKKLKSAVCTNEILPNSFNSKYVINIS